MAEIFIALDPRTNRTVAFKRMLPHVASDPDFLNRFFHEIRIQISLKHKNVVELLDCSPGVSNAYIVMEYIDGGTLQGLLEQAGRFPWDVALFCAEEALRGLGAAHRKGIVHRDVKPQNIMWTKAGAVKIADFGISQAEHLTRLTSTGMVVGTPSFMSPEQARGEALDSRSDIFSIGTVLYILLTGRNPFTADSVAVTLRRIVDIEPEPPTLIDPNLPLGVDSLMRKIWAKDRDHRFASAEEACEAIHAVLGQEGIEHPLQNFLRFTQNPSGYLLHRLRECAEEKARKAAELLKNASAPPEEALWLAYQTMTYLPQDEKAKTLYETAALRAGQRERPVENPKIKELEEQVRKDPDNVVLLLQLAKLYRLERDIVGVMKLYQRLKYLAPTDVYTQSQIASLIGGHTRSAVPAAHPEARSRTPQAHTPATVPVTVEENSNSNLGLYGLIAVLVVLVAAGIWWVNGPAKRMSEESKAKAEIMARAVLRNQSGNPAADPLQPVRPGQIEDKLQKILEKGALKEKDDGPKVSLGYYRDSLPLFEGTSAYPTLLKTVVDTAIKAGEYPVALQYSEALIEMGGPWASRGLVFKARIYELTSNPKEAYRAYEELTRSPEKDAYALGMLKVAEYADRAGDSIKALTLYEELIARAAETPEANSARLSAAALYKAADRKGDARRVLEEAKRRAAAGSDVEKRAEEALKTLE